MKENDNRLSDRKKLFVLACMVVILIIAVICYLFLAGGQGNSGKRAGNMIEETSEELHNKGQGEKQDTQEVVQNEPTMDMAKTALDKYLTSFYVKDEKGGYIVGEGFWQQAEIFEIIIDAYEQTK